MPARGHQETQQDFRPKGNVGNYQFFQGCLTHVCSTTLNIYHMSADGKDIQMHVQHSPLRSQQLSTQ